MKKSEFRDFFAKCKPYVKLNRICKEAGIKQQNLSSFMSGYDYALSIDKLQHIYNILIDKMSEIVA